MNLGVCCDDLLQHMPFSPTCHGRQRPTTSTISVRSRDVSKTTLDIAGVKFGMTLFKESHRLDFLTQRETERVIFSRHWRGSSSVCFLGKFSERYVALHAISKQSASQIRTVILSAFHGWLSVMGSSILLFTVTYRWRKRGISSTRDRTLLGMSAIDILSSTALMLGPLPSSAGEIDMVGAVGTPES
eukprot:scaffold4927_cov139-Amphora_coffeaeformis.AAC.19